MSALKQMEEMKLTPEEIQELVILLDSILPKVQERVKKGNQFSILTRNLSEKLSLDSGIEYGTTSQEVAERQKDMENGFNLLTSARKKLGDTSEKLKDLIGKD